MGESVRAPLPVRQCRKSWKNAGTCDFGQKSSLLRCAPARSACEDSAYQPGPTITAELAAVCLGIALGAMSRRGLRDGLTALGAELG